MSDQSIPDFRTYRHIQCQNETVVSGDAFKVVSSPMSGLGPTQCSICKAMFPLADFEWVDTGENLIDYYARHSKEATDRQRFLCSKEFMLTLIILGAILTAAGFLYLVRDLNFLVKAMSVFIGLVVGAVIGANVHEKVFENPITQKVCKVNDTRLLT